MCCDLVLSFQMVNPLFGSDLYFFYHLIFSCALTSRAVPVHFQAIHSFSVDAPYCLSACFICLLYDCVHYHGSPRERWFNPSPCALKGPLFLCFSGHRTWRCVCVCVRSLWSVFCGVNPLSGGSLGRKNGHRGCLLFTQCPPHSWPEHAQMSCRLAESTATEC